MTAIRIDGNILATKVRERIATDVAALKAHGITPGLAVVLVGDDPASQVYVRNKAAACAKVGMHSVIHRLAADASESELLTLIEALNKDAAIHGILVQLPLPKQIAEKKVLEAVAVQKDVDGFHAENVGALMIGEPRFVSCTPAGCIADTALKSDVIAVLKSAKTTNVTFTALAGAKKITVPVEMTGFGDAWAALALPGL